MKEIEVSGRDLVVFQIGARRVCVTKRIIDGVPGLRIEANGPIVVEPTAGNFVVIRAWSSESRP